MSRKAWKAKEKKLCFKKPAETTGANRRKAEVKAVALVKMKNV